MPEVQALRRVPLFAELEEADLAALAQLVHRRRYGAVQEIFAEGEPASGFHVVETGRVKVFKAAPDGKERVLHIWGPGEPFGEVAVFAGIPFPAHAQALEETTTLFIPRGGLLQLLGRRPELALRMIAVLSFRLRDFASQIEALSLREVPGRLAAYALLLDEQQGGAGRVELDLSKALLANVLGTTPETFSRVLTRMAREGLVSEDGRRGLRLLDRDALEELAAGRTRLA